MRQGLIAGLVAYGLWGLVPLYFKTLQGVPADQVLAHRVLWSAAVLFGLLTWVRLWPDLTGTLARPYLRLLLFGSTVMIALNWYLYIYSVETHQVVESSLGYFITPLVNVVLGMVFFRERLRRLQWFAVGLAAVGVGYLVSRSGIPWLALGLAGTFSCYGVLRKNAAVNSLTGLSIETFSLCPLALLWLGWANGQGVGKFGHFDQAIDWLLALSGVVTTVPLLCFGRAARLLPLSVLGFLQYVSPTVQFVLAVTVFGEFHKLEGNLPGFISIWVGLAVFTLDSVLQSRRRFETPVKPTPRLVPVAEECCES